MQPRNVHAEALLRTPPSSNIYYMPLCSHSTIVSMQPGNAHAEALLRPPPP